MAHVRFEGDKYYVRFSEKWLINSIKFPENKGRAANHPTLRKDAGLACHPAVDSVTDSYGPGASIYGRKKAEVRAKLRDTLLSIERGEYIEPSRLTVGDWLEEWFRIYCLPHKKASTCTGYEDEIFLHIKPYIGRVPLQELRAQHVQANVNALVKEGKAPATVRKAYTILHAALDQAVVNQKAELFQRNLWPCIVDLQ